MDVEQKIQDLKQQIESIEGQLNDPNTNPHDPFVIGQGELLNELQGELRKFEELEM